MTFLQASPQLELEQLGPTASSATEPVFHRPLTPPLKRRKLLQEAPYSGNFDNIARDGINLGSVLAVRPHNVSRAPSAPNLLKPIALLHRARIPLSWLDPCPAPNRKLRSGRLYASNISVLENSQRNGEPVTLTARLISEKPPSSLRASTPRTLEIDEIYAIEKVSKGIYAICSLGDWVHERDLLDAAILKSSGLSSSSTLIHTTKSESHSDEENCPRRLKDIAAPTTPVKEEEDEQVKLDLLPVSASRSSNRLLPDSDLPPTVRVLPRTSNITSQKPGVTISRTSIPSNNVSLEAPSPSTPEPRAPTAVAFPTPLSQDPAQSPQEIFDHLRTKYLEALYISKTSVAYFAKGPLSRTRALFASPGNDSDLDPASLTAFYREMILPMKKMDTKYRTSLPELVKASAPKSGVSDDEDGNAHENNDGNKTSKMRKPRKSANNKLKRNCLYGEEDVLVVRWWRGRDLATDDSETGDQEMKRLIGDLRLRETQLQILLILETLTVEVYIKQHQIPTVAKTSGDPTDKTDSKAKASKSSKKKKQEDLTVILELLVDRLCIWHTVTFDDLSSSNATKSANSSTLDDQNQPRHQQQQKQGTKQSDVIRDFATEVVIPFYRSRLPEQCTMISRKLDISHKPTSRTSHPKARPGAAAKRIVSASGSSQTSKPSHQSGSTSQRSLQRLLTDERSLPRGSRGSSIPRQAFTRSVSDVHELRKREASKSRSATPQLDFAFDSGTGVTGGPGSITSLAGVNTRGGILKPRKDDNREVDLNLFTRQHEHKLKRMKQLIERKGDLANNVAPSSSETSMRRKSDGTGLDRKRSSSLFNGVPRLSNAPAPTISSRKPRNPIQNPLNGGVQVLATPSKGASGAITGQGTGVQVMASPCKGAPALATPQKTFQVMATPSKRPILMTPRRHSMPMFVDAIPPSSPCRPND